MHAAIAASGSLGWGSTRAPPGAAAPAPGVSQPPPGAPSGRGFLGGVSGAGAAPPPLSSPPRQQGPDEPEEGEKIPTMNMTQWPLRSDMIPKVRIRTR